MPTVLLVDDHEVVRHGLRHVLDRNPDAVVVVLTGAVTAEEIITAARAAADEVIDAGKSMDADRAIATGEANGADRVIDLDAAQRTGRRPRLSRRECEVLTLLAEGLGAAQIARALFISESTTKTHISHLYEKLGAGNRAQALMSALRFGLLEQPERI